MESRSKINHERTCQNISKSGASEKEDHRENAKVVRTSEQKKDGGCRYKATRFRNSTL